MASTASLKDKLPLLISLAVIGGLVGSYFAIPAVHDALKEAYKVLVSDDRQRISQYVGEFGFWGPLWLIVAFVLQMFLVVINVVALMVVAVLAYGPVWGSVIALAGILAASTVGYWLGNALGAAAVKKLVGDNTEKKMEVMVEKYGFWAVIVTRISPFLSNDAIAFIAGISCMNYLKFIVATVIGILPLTLLIAWLSTDIDRLKNGLIWVSVLSLLAFIVYVWLDKRKRQKTR